ncbi:MULTISPECIES: hypothetical protein [unclassified Kocuria]|uniref:hypothetical protein n=1 Tax=unclassified Kocuria TaxID=2649579 RepID=UPI000F89AA42|nr:MULTISPECIES: hypothetical protein [unclassified Kocuria]RUP84747.1 hypothetical protein D8M39_02470 [Kocuria sp. HSID17590]RUQ09962.1 hypothetical protein D8M38_05590 [Kocuria sp. HSID17582]
MSGRTPSEDPFESIIRANSWDDVPRDDEDLEPWAEDVPWEPREQPADGIPPELAEDPEDERYDPDPGPVTSGISPAMLRALSVILAVLVVMLGLALLPGPLPGLVWVAGIVGIVAGLVLVFRALPEDAPEDDDGAVV